MKCDCKTCRYRYAQPRGWFTTKVDYFCTHPNTEQIKKYWKDHKIKKIEGHLYYGFDFDRKTTPKWCPKRKEE